MVTKLNIALCHFRVGETDGVSLEMDKWKSVLEKTGHNIIYISGSKGSLSNVEIISELHYKSSFNNKIVDNAYVKLHSYKSELEFKNEIEQEANSIEKKLTKITLEKKIDVLIVNNIFSLGWNLAASLGFYKSILNTNVKCICHHHDFYWEREKYSSPTCNVVKQYLQEHFPPKHKNIKHVVINSLAKKELFKRKKIESEVVPNVFDFDNNWVVDDYNFDLRESLGIKKNDLVVLQATRIVKRKGIELAIDFIAELNSQKYQIKGKKLFNNQIFTEESKVVFLLVGLNEEAAYFNKIIKYAKHKNVLVKHVNNRVDHKRSIINSTKKYSLWDTYVYSDIVSYTSLLEGWGNQFIEALVAKKIVVSYQYPVFEADILPLKFTTINLGNTSKVKNDGLVEVDNFIIKNAVKKTIELLLNKGKYRNVVEDNFNKGKENLSLKTLQNLLNHIINYD